MSKKFLKPSTILAPVPVVLVTCGYFEKSNIATVAWTGIINSEPPLVYVSIRSTRYSYELIQNTKEFAINLPSEKLVYETDYCGSKSGREIDKFEYLKLTKEQGKIINTPLIKECPINIECKLLETKELGSHCMFIGEIVSCAVNDEFIEEEKIIYDNINLLSYMGNNYYINSKKVGYRGMGIKERFN